MNVRVRFLGGAQSVTGSKYLLEIGHKKLLIDCGMFQGRKELRLHNWDSLPIEINSIDAVVLTHAHIDHSGYLPKIVKEGFTGNVYCTEATKGLLDIMLLDAAKLQEEEAHFAAKKGYSKHEKPQPLFNSKDAEDALALLKTYPYGAPIDIFEDVHLVFHNAGHILGSAIIEIRIKNNSNTKTIVFSGDLGRNRNPILGGPAVINTADILFVESTYGDRINEDKNVEERFVQLVNDALHRKGCILIPAFAVGRTQLLLYYFKQFMESGEIPSVPVYIDSPMAISTTKLYWQYPNYHTLADRVHQQASVFDYPQFHYYRSREASTSLNAIEKDAIIISASGMCTGGRILHHLYHRLHRNRDTLMFVGYQAEETRGRKILDGEPTIKIFGDEMIVNCHIEKFDGLSAHADKAELLQWVGNFTSPPQKTFIVHGEKTSSNALKESIMHDLGWQNVIVPEYFESFDLFTSI